MRVDLTFQAVKRQLSAMPEIEFFEIGIREQKTGKMLTRKFDREGILKSLQWLKHKNGGGCDIYIRPDPNCQHPYLLVDDVEIDQIESMANLGFHHCLLLETSLKNHQVLLKLTSPANTETRKCMERALSHKFNSDFGSCDGQHFFRLAGFKNQKPEHSGFNAAAAPWVLCRSAKANTRLSVSARGWLYSLPRDSGVCVPREIVNELLLPPDSNLVDRLAGLIGSHMPNIGQNRSQADFRACRQLLNSGIAHEDLGARQDSCRLSHAANG